MTVLSDSSKSTHRRTHTHARKQASNMPASSAEEDEMSSAEATTTTCSVAAEDLPIDVVERILVHVAKSSSELVDVINASMVARSWSLAAKSSTAVWNELLRSHCYGGGSASDMLKMPYTEEEIEITDEDLPNAAKERVLLREKRAENPRECFKVRNL